MPRDNTLAAIGDIVAAIKRYSLVGMLGWQDVKLRYRRSTLGPFWLTISMGVMILTIGVVFGLIFKTPLTEFLPFLSSGIILWGFISTVITEGCVSFVASEGIIKQLPIPLFVHIMRMMWRNILILGHNIVLFPLVLLVLQRPINLTMLAAIPGFTLLVLNLTWIALLLGIVCARYRDLTQIVASVIQVFFYLTPIVWMPKTISSRASSILLDMNPMYHLLEIVRAPLLGTLPSLTNWAVSCGIALLGWVVALAVYRRFRHRISYWL